MRRAIKHYFILTIIFSLGIAFGARIFAQDLNVSYPSIPGASRPESTTTPIVLYLKYIYNLAIAIAGIILFVSLIRGGLSYFSSGGNPAKMKRAKEQMQNSLLGVLIIFSSYLILNTINPELVIFPTFNIQSPSSIPVSPPNLSVDTVTVNFKEIPIGTLLTSEFSVSSFIATSSPPKVCAPTSSPTSSSDVHPPTLTACVYSSFEGALHGERLKRIHEVASTTLPVVDMLATLSQQLLGITEDFKDTTEKLVNYALHKCNCENCDKPPCIGGIGQGCCSMNTCSCSNDSCKNVRKEMDALRQDTIPNMWPDIRCQMAENEFLYKAFLSFLDANNLLDQEDSDNDYIGSDEAQDLISQIDSCVNEGLLDQDQWQKIYDPATGTNDLIELMATVENKGTVSPETDPPERDVQTNLNHLKAIIEAIEEGRKYIEPYTSDVDALSWTGQYKYSGHLTFVPRAQLVDFLGTTQYKVEKIVGSGGFLPPGQSPETTLKVEIDRYKLSNLANNIYVKPVGGDPAIFYTYSIPEIETFFPPVTKKESNIVYAQGPTSTPTSTENLYGPPSVCSRVVEIPTGLTIDKGLELSSEVWSELYNIWDNGHKIADNMENLNINATSTIEYSEALINLTSPDACDCAAGNCISDCTEEYYPCNCYTDPDGNTTCETCCRCECVCLGLTGCPLNDINKNWGKFRQAVAEMKQLYRQITERFQREIKESFCKLDSGSDENGDPCYIDSDFCCPDKNGNCRDSDNRLEVDKIEERKYTLKEKLIEVQKLLNRCREMINKDKHKFRGQSAYEILIKQLIDMGLAQKEELKNIRYFDKLDLHNCWIRGFAEDVVAQSQEFGAQLLNCKVAQGKVAEYLYKAIDPENPELCSPDPLLDCDYFHPTSTDRYFTDPARRQGRLPLSCYCYDEDIKEKQYQSRWFPKMLKGNLLVPAQNITSNLFCCVEPREAK